MWPGVGVDPVALGAASWLAGGAGLTPRLPSVLAGGAGLAPRLPSVLAGETLIDRVPAAAHPAGGLYPRGPAPSERHMEPASGS